MPSLSPIEKVLDAIKAGKIVIVMDDEDRENEGDFVYAAETATDVQINFMLQHGRGQVCMPILPGFFRTSGELPRLMLSHNLVKSQRVWEFLPKPTNINPQRSTAMRNFASNFNVVIIALCAVALFSFVAFAAKGPCVGGAQVPYTLDPVEEGNTKTEESGTYHLDQSCANENENGCTETFLATATRKSGTKNIYKKVPALNPQGYTWELDQTVPVVEYGRQVC